ncbi:CPBP family intramembrane glutamic endopeptidase [Lederbergia citrea]|uniref:CPBP family intramembrane glutamic endopeptidase n=1 Tax=Lederbergia citrea TaxID=2833581 RepID=UPI001BC92304|nr:CPBP family intramembrane glutamic endopeptidase [Lederbergia citrea]MBS4202498.1 CPBP family intramembrane metalloprotease [Lederbergia citrea]
MLYKILGLLFLWGMILFTVLQTDTILWILSALCSIIFMHFISKWTKQGGFSQIGLQMQKRWLRYLFFGCLIGVGYILFRYIIMFSAGIITFHPISFDVNPLIISTVILLVSTAYIGFAEEIVFRGYLINMLHPYFSNKIVIIISATVFTLGHLVDGNFNISRIFFFFFSGLFFATCYIVTRSLWFVAGIHWSWDFTWFYLGADGSTSSSKIIDVTLNQEMSFYYGWIDAIIALGLFLLLLLLTKRSFSKTTTISG